jgi:hypothetical protein
MGKQYAEPFRQLVRDLGPSELIAFIAPDGIDKRYQEHILDTLEELGVAIAVEADEANFAISGYAVRAHDDAVGLTIETDQRGTIHLFADGIALPAPA